MSNGLSTRDRLARHGRRQLLDAIKCRLINTLRSQHVALRSLSTQARTQSTHRITQTHSETHIQNTTNNNHNTRLNMETLSKRACERSLKFDERLAAANIMRTIFHTSQQHREQKKLCGGGGERSQSIGLKVHTHAQEHGDGGADSRRLAVGRMEKHSRRIHEEEVEVAVETCLHTANKNTNTHLAAHTFMHTQRRIYVV